jgi:hypothetical protein
MRREKMIYAVPAFTGVKLLADLSLLPHDAPTESVWRDTKKDTPGLHTTFWRDYAPHK